MGREIEKGILSHIVNKAKNNNVEKIKAQFIPTEKNKPIEKFLPDCGFKKEGDFWVYYVKSSFVIPDCLTVSVE